MSKTKQTKDQVRVASTASGAVKVVGVVRGQATELLREKKQADYSGSLELKHVREKALTS